METDIGVGSSTDGFDSNDEFDSTLEKKYEIDPNFTTHGKSLSKVWGE